MQAKKHAIPASLHPDPSLPAVVHADELDWVSSPQPGVDRRFLEREGLEVARATSIVRYAAGSSFEAHVHQLGEEYLVLEGTFSDESGDYAAGTYVRNPPGSSHRPFTRDGCTIFVKLRQMSPSDQNYVVESIDAPLVEDSEAPGRSGRVIFDSSGHETVRIERLQSGTAWMNREPSGGEEILLLSGELLYGNERCRPLTWIRIPHGMEQPITAETNCCYWVKRGHLRPR